MRMSSSTACRVHLTGAVASFQKTSPSATVGQRSLHLAAAGLDLPLFHVGLSSGGHLAAVMACQADVLVPRGALIAYAPINANHRLHKVPPGKPDYPPLEKQNFYDDWPIGLANYPHGLPKVPLFLAYALHDQSVPIQHATTPC